MRFGSIISLVIVAGATSHSASATECSRNQRTVTYGDKSADLQDYTCVVGSEANKLRIGFYRVSEVVAGALIMKAPIPALDRIFGTPVFVQNEVFQEVKTLFSNYGTSETYEPDRTLELSIAPASPTPSKASDSDDIWNEVPISEDPKANTPVRIWHLANTTSAVSDGILLRSPSEITLNTDHWPAEYHMTYSCPVQEKAFISCTNLWKYIGPNDFATILEDIKVAAQRAENGMSMKNAATEFLPSKQSIHSGMSEMERTFGLFNYLNKGKLPSDFLTVGSSTGLGKCAGSNWEFGISNRPLTLDFAIIENLSEQTIRIRDLVGYKNPNQDFRAIDQPIATGDANPSPLGLGEQALPPGGRIAISLRISFRRPLIAEDPDIGDETPEKTFKSIQSKPAHYVFTEVIGGFNNRKMARKVRESFKKPITPAFTEYAYGPEIALDGLDIEGDYKNLEKDKSNLVLIKDSVSQLNLDINKIKVNPNDSGDGSCPILYSWDERSRDWIYHGKILHAAQGAENSMTERVPLRSVRTRFRITEEEPEVSFIDNVFLRITLNDGREFRVPPRNDFPKIITQNKAVELEFSLPTGITSELVVRSEIQIGGYYRRYSDILAAE